MALRLMVDKDGTEKCTNNYPYLGQVQLENQFEITGDTHYKEILPKYKDKWYDDMTDGYYQVPEFNGVILPKGTIAKILGTDITFEDGVIEVND